MQNGWRRSSATFARLDANPLVRSFRFVARSDFTGSPFSDSQGQDRYGDFPEIREGGGNAKNVRLRSENKGFGGGGSRTREHWFRQHLDDARLLNSTRCRPIVCGSWSSPPPSTTVHSDRPGSWRHSGGGGHPCPPLVQPVRRKRRDSGQIVLAKLTSRRLHAYYRASARPNTA
jgi:hypothetical protein